MPFLKSLHARQILDSRGNPTIEVECELEDGGRGRAAVPSGASTGTHEVVELRDNDPGKFWGKSVKKAVSNVNTKIAQGLGSFDISDQRQLDQSLIEMDGTPDKSSLGANAILGVSMAVAVARADGEGRSLYVSLADQFGQEPPSLLPVPLVNVINGGAHADSGLSFQEFMLVPVGFRTFSEALRAAVETFHELKAMLAKLGHVTAVGDEGGFAPHLKANAEALELLTKAIGKASYEGKILLALDAAASEFAENGSYEVDARKLRSPELTAYYRDLAGRFPIVSIEDSHSEDDWEGFRHMTKELGDDLQLVGDDLLVTNTSRIEEAIKKGACNAVLIKLNQIGTVTETVDAIELARNAGWNCIISHRSGETEDTFIADFAVAMGTGQIKTGSMSRSERTCKYNQLLRIEEELGKKAEYRNPFA